MPTYVQRFLFPRRDELIARKSLSHSNRTDWWGLSRSRPTWAFDSTPRLVTKYFGGPGGFAADLMSDFMVVQGHVWFLKEIRTFVGADIDDIVLPVDDLLCAYLALLNSRRFGGVLELFSPHVAGGQFNLSPKYVDQIPIPNLVDLARDDRMGRLVSSLVELGREPRLTEDSWSKMADHITTELYGGDFFDRI